MIFFPLSEAESSFCSFELSFLTCLFGVAKILGLKLGCSSEAVSCTIYIM